METKVLLGKNQRFYKANMHCHSNLSDGKLTPEELKDLHCRYYLVCFRWMAYCGLRNILFSRWSCWRNDS